MIHFFFVSIRRQKTGGKNALLSHSEKQFEVLSGFLLTVSLLAFSADLCSGKTSTYRLVMMVSVYGSQAHLLTSQRKPWILRLPGRQSPLLILRNVTYPCVSKRKARLHFGCISNSVISPDNIPLTENRCPSYMRL